MPVTLESLPVRWPAYGPVERFQQSETFASLNPELKPRTRIPKVGVGVITSSISP